MNRPTPSENRSAPDPLAVEGHGGVIGAWWAKVQRSVWPAAIVVGGVPSKDVPQMSFAEDQDAVGELGSGGQDESFGEAVRSRTSRWDSHGIDAGAGQDGIERSGELAGAVADEEPERGGTVVEVHQQVAGRSDGWSIRGCARSGCQPRGRRRRRSASASQRSRRGRSPRPACWRPECAGTAARMCRWLAAAPVESAAA